MAPLSEPRLIFLILRTDIKTYLDVLLNGCITFKWLDNALENFLKSLNKQFFILVFCVALFAGAIVPLSLKKFSPTSFCILNRYEAICKKAKILAAVDCKQTGVIDEGVNRIVKEPGLFISCSLFIEPRYAIYIEESKDISAKSFDNFILLQNEGLGWNPFLPFQSRVQFFANGQIVNGLQEREQVEMRSVIQHEGTYLVINSESG